MEDQKRKSEENHQEQLQHPHQYSLLCPGIFYGVLHNCPVSEVKVILDPNVIAKQKGLTSSFFIRAKIHYQCAPNQQN